MYKVGLLDPIECYRNTNKRLNILIVDDDENSRESLKYILSSRGHSVTTLDEGMKCVNRCSSNKYDIIFMDYHINDLDGTISGTDISTMVKECFDIDTPIYAYTGDNSRGAIDDFKRNNMKGAFIKPVDPSLIYNFLQINENKQSTNIYLPRLARKNKNFIYFN